MGRKILFVFVITFFSIYPLVLFSQSYIKGKITAADDKKPIQFANVVIPGTEIGTMSDDEGKFYLDYPDSLKKDHDLLISAIGYKRFRQPLAQLPKNLNVSLEDSLFLLEEVKTVAYNYFMPLKWQNKRNKKEEVLLTFAARDKGTIDNFLKVFKEYQRKSKRKTDNFYVWRKVKIDHIDDKIKVLLLILPCAYCPVEGSLNVTMLVKGKKNGNLMESDQYKGVVISYFQSLLDKSMKQGISLDLLDRKGKMAFKDSKPYTGKVFKYYKSGQKGLVGQYVNGKKDGVWQYWYSNGSEKLIGIFKEGVKIGEWKLWYPNGQIKMLVHYKDGKLDGINTWWYPNGIKKKEAIFNNGKFINKKEWDEKGRLMVKSF